MQILGTSTSKSALAPSVFNDFDLNTYHKIMVVCDGSILHFARDILAKVIIEIPSKRAKFAETDFQTAKIVFATALTKNGEKKSNQQPAPGRGHLTAHTPPQTASTSLCRLQAVGAMVLKQKPLENVVFGAVSIVAHLVLGKKGGRTESNRTETNRNCMKLKRTGSFYKPNRSHSRFTEPNRTGGFLLSVSQLVS